MENSGWPRPTSVLNIDGHIPGGSASTGEPAGGGTEYLPERRPKPSFALQIRKILQTKNSSWRSVLSHRNPSVRTGNTD